MQEQTFFKQERGTHEYDDSFLLSQKTNKASRKSMVPLVVRDKIDHLFENLEIKITGQQDCSIDKHQLSEIVYSEVQGMMNEYGVPKSRLVRQIGVCRTMFTKKITKQVQEYCEEKGLRLFPLHNGDSLFGVVLLSPRAPKKSGGKSEVKNKMRQVRLDENFLGAAKAIKLEETEAHRSRLEPLVVRAEMKPQSWVRQSGASSYIEGNHQAEESRENKKRISTYYDQVSFRAVQYFKAVGRQLNVRQLSENPSSKLTSLTDYFQTSSLQKDMMRHPSLRDRVSTKTRQGREGGIKSLFHLLQYIRNLGEHEPALLSRGKVMMMCEAVQGIDQFTELSQREDLARQALSEIRKVNAQMISQEKEEIRKRQSRIHND